MVQGNPYFCLRAYTTADPVRVAAILLCTQGEGLAVARDTVADVWATWWPRHGTMTARQSIRARISRSLPPLRAAGICHAAAGDLIIDDPGLLLIAASNLGALIDDDGYTLPSSRWRARPGVPGNLRPIFEATHPLPGKSLTPAHTTTVQ